MKINRDYFFGETIIGGIIVLLAIGYVAIFVFSFGGICYAVDVCRGNMSIYAFLALNLPGCIVTIYFLVKGVLSFFKKIFA